MGEKIIIWFIIAVAALSVGRRFYRQWRAATDKKTQLSCGNGCCSCSIASECSTTDQ